MKANFLVAAEHLSLRRQRGKHLAMRPAFSSIQSDIVSQAGTTS
jgi:hypothetical protein